MAVYDNANIFDTTFILNKRNIYKPTLKCFHKNNNERYSLKNFINRTKYGTFDRKKQTHNDTRV